MKNKPESVREQILKESMFRQMATLRRTMNEMKRLGIEPPREISTEQFEAIQKSLNAIEITTKQLEKN